MAPHKADQYGSVDARLQGTSHPPKKLAEPSDKEVGHSLKEKIALRRRGSHPTQPNARPHHPSIHVDNLIHSRLDGAMPIPRP
ncbi:hypothetical protein C4D60_Mb08t04390 [Musa balbisiana]|uniref:Uncharacterized protein n=1 Tax=Musa balbisiana TaxID=52838 RepID=A0A4S8K198_MUSBA|nr:hypothetical protein C4D60_Mb08t04390 [Musa balbisiana]